ncbi:response regulator transcription factor [Nonomuraea sp. NPDC003560]|uniref:response regulator transcription factor n=1 Tax=Nonomuraea sp. NPDC003560 TaxID=3364341 RepID=UPI0036B902FE
MLQLAQRSASSSMEAIQRLEVLKEELLDSARPARADDLALPSVNVTCHPLTGREFHVLELICRGQTNRQIARGLDISEKTVKNYVHAIFGKLRVRSRTEAAMEATRQGWYAASTAARPLPPG